MQVDAVILRLVLEHFRENPPQAFLNVLGVSFQVMIVLVIAGTDLKPLPHPYAVIVVARWVLAAMAWMALAVSYVVVAVNWISQIRERTQQFAILKLLGASSALFFELFLYETTLVTLPGTAVGIILTYTLQRLVAFILPDIFTLQTAYDWWPLACLLSAAVFLIPGFLLTRNRGPGDLTRELS